jgi:hypothetical protein
MPAACAVTKAMGRERGLDYFGKLAASAPAIRSGHTLLAELVASGEILMVPDAHVQGVERLKKRGAPVDWKPLQPAFGQPSSVGLSRRAPHPHAALLFADFILSREGQEIIKARERVPSSRAVDSALNRFDYALVDPVIVLDEWAQWEKRWSALFLKGQKLRRRRIDRGAVGAKPETALLCTRSIFVLRAPACAPLQPCRGTSASRLTSASSSRSRQRLDLGGTAGVLRMQAAQVPGPAHRRRARAADPRRERSRARRAKQPPRSSFPPGNRACQRYSSRMSLRAYRIAPTDSTTFHPRLIGTRGAVASNSYLSANAGADVLKAGGNALDAAVAMTLVEGLVNPQMNTLGGECPALVRLAGESRVIALNGNMAAPMAATPEAFRARGYEDVPDEDIMAAGVPATLSALVTALKKWGTMSFRDVSEPARELAAKGFAVSTGLRQQHKFGLAALEGKFRADWPASASSISGGQVPQVGQLLRNEALARTLDYLAHAKDPHEAFYRGDVRPRSRKFSAQREGLLSRKDLESFQTRVENTGEPRASATASSSSGFWAS